VWSKALCPTLQSPPQDENAFPVLWSGACRSHLEVLGCCPGLGDADEGQQRGVTCEKQMRLSDEAHLLETTFNCAMIDGSGLLVCMADEKRGGEGEALGQPP